MLRGIEVIVVGRPLQPDPGHVGGTTVPRGLWCSPSDEWSNNLGFPAQTADPVIWTLPGDSCITMRFHSSIFHFRYSFQSSLFYHLLILIRQSIFLIRLILIWHNELSRKQDVVVVSELQIWLIEEQQQQHFRMTGSSKTVCFPLYNNWNLCFYSFFLKSQHDLTAIKENKKIHFCRHHGASNTHINSE